MTSRKVIKIDIYNFFNFEFFYLLSVTPEVAKLKQINTLNFIYCTYQETIGAQFFSTKTF